MYALTRAWKYNVRIGQVNSVSISELKTLIIPKDCAYPFARQFIHVFIRSFTEMTKKANTKHRLHNPFAKNQRQKNSIALLSNKKRTQRKNEKKWRRKEKTEIKRVSEWETVTKGGCLRCAEVNQKLKQRSAKGWHYKGLKKKSKRRKERRCGVHWNPYQRIVPDKYLAFFSRRVYNLQRLKVIGTYDRPNRAC